MNPSMLGILLASFIAQQPPAAPAPQTSAQAPAQEKPISANLKVRIATTSYLADGRVITASSSDWPLAINKTVTGYATSGKTLCESRAATVDQPTDVAAGWRVEVTPQSEAAGELVLQVAWRPLARSGLLGKDALVASANATLANARLAQRRVGGGPGTTLTLHPGDRIVVDYTSVSGQPGFWVFGDALKSTKADGFYLQRYALAANTAASNGCNAVGMSLEIGLEPAKTEAVVQAELWLVRPNRDGTEQSERQVLRLPVGQPASNYYFDEARLAGVTRPEWVKLTLAKVSGELAAASVGADGKIHLNLKLARKYEPVPRGKEAEASVETSYRDLLATPGEVLAFQLPTMDIPVIVTNVDGGKPSNTIRMTTLPQLSVRLRTELVK